MVFAVPCNFASMCTLERVKVASSLLFATSYQLLTTNMHGCAGANALQQQQQQRGKGKKRKPTKEQLLAEAEAKRSRKEAALADPDAKVSSSTFIKTASIDQSE